MSDFYTAAIPDPFTILKLRLKAYSLGHIILLHRVDSSFVTGKQLSLKDQIADLATSVFICSQTYEDAVDALDNPKLSKFMLRWQRKLGRFDFAAKAKEFSDYIQAHSKSPIFKVEQGKARPNACPLVQSVKIALLSETTLTESQILNRCWALCLWDFVTLMARSGKVDIVDGDSIGNAQAVADQLYRKFNSKGGS